MVKEKKKKVQPKEIKLFLEVVPKDEEEDTCEMWLVYKVDKKGNPSEDTIAVVLHADGTKLIVEGEFLTDENLYDKAMDLIELHRTRCLTFGN